MANRDKNYAIITITAVTRPGDVSTISLPSIINQERAPDATYLVADSWGIFDMINIPEINKLQIKKLVNRREKNLSGAINTALSEILNAGYDPDNTFIAVLDDDDWWEPCYLKNSLDKAIEEKADWVISGIIRHEDENGEGIKLSIPVSLDEKDFFAGNPHIQGSNLFIRVSYLLMAGGYDENLPSTTDRDLCIRLLAMGNIKYTFLRKYMVHYRAYGNERLSDPSTYRKALGLQNFNDKYQDIMDGTSYNAFIRRSKKLFGYDVTETIYNEGGREHSEPILENRASPEPQAHIIFGVMVSDRSDGDILIDKFIEFTGKIKINEVVMLDNTGQGDFPDGKEEKLKENGIELKIIKKDDIASMADNGLLGNYYREKSRRLGIPFGRTALQHVLYIESLKFENPVIWIIDDDIDISNIYWGNISNRVSKNRFMELMKEWKNANVSIVIGKIGGDAPLPALSTIRTQLLDLYFNLRAFSNDTARMNYKTRTMQNNKYIEEFVSYYYDFPENDFRNLETPMWHSYSLNTDNSNEILHKIAGDMPEILDRSIFRKVEHYGLDDIYYDKTTVAPGPTRGGNAIILNREVLKEFTDSAPVSNNIPYRRGDTLWVILNKRMGLYPENNIISSPLMLVQKRSGKEESRTKINKLISDILGSCFTRTMDQYLYRKIKQLADSENPEYLKIINFTSYEIAEIVSNMDIKLENRLLQLIMNYWRIKGLISSIDNAVSHIIGVDNIDSVTKILIKDNWRILNESVSSVFNEKTIDEIVCSIKNYNRKDLEDFLSTMYLSNYNYSVHLEFYKHESELTEIKKIIEDEFKVDNIKFLGNGKEGAVFTDGKFCYKYFYNSDNDFSKKLTFITNNFRGKEFDNISRIIDIHKNENQIMIKTEYVDGDIYNGGRLHDLLNLLLECRSNGICITNISPKNIIVNSSGIKYVDIGRDIEEYTDQGFIKMCRKCYITYRWYFRTDIAMLLHMSITDETFPELYGFDIFMESLSIKTNYQMGITKIEEIFNKIHPDNVLDYGCGTGAIADTLSKNYDVSVFDIDMSGFYKHHPSAGPPAALKVLDMDFIDKFKGLYHTVLLSQVFCSVNDEEVTDILNKIKGVIQENGNLVISVCNPYNLKNNETQTHIKIQPTGDYNSNFQYRKFVKFTGGTRIEYHRPVNWYILELKKASFIVTDISETDGIDIESQLPGSEFLFITCKARREIINPDVSLMIKTSAMEWRTIDTQIRHIVNQLEGPEKFLEKVVVTDKNTSGFLRQYDYADMETFIKKLDSLISDGIIDRVIFTPAKSEYIKSLSLKWFGVETTDIRASNGQNTITSIYGFEQLKTKYILQLDSDCIIGRTPGPSYLKVLKNVLENNDNALTVGFPIYSKTRADFTIGNNHNKWRTEVRFSLINRELLMNLLPLPNEIDETGKLALPWHRSVDMLNKNSKYGSYRGNDGNAFFIHVPNNYKNDINGWLNSMYSVERGYINENQSENVNLISSDPELVFPERKEEMVIIVKGRNVPFQKLRRCFKSLSRQDYQNFGIMAIDAASVNGMDEYLYEIAGRLYRDRITILKNIEALSSIENIYIAIEKVCKNPESIIVMLDADDALIPDNALSRILELYHNGADLTSGSMLRADKEAKYKVNFDNPRKNGGGNVWQHIRTFKKYLFDSLDMEDLKLDNEWIPVAEDWAFMLRLVELSKNPVNIADKIYYYDPSEDKYRRSREELDEIIARIIAKQARRTK